MEKKYKLTEETINVGDKTLHHIEALRDFGDVKKGDKGGFVENEKNLSQRGDCWVYENARVYGKARVFDKAKVRNEAKVLDDAVVYGNAEVFGNAKVCGNATIFGNAQIRCDAVVCEDAKIYGNVIVCGNARVYGNAKVYGNAIISSNAKVCGNAMVRGKANVYSHADIRGDAVITADTDYIVFKNWWSSGRFFTWTRSNNMWRVGCFYGTSNELIEKAYKDSKLSGKEYKRVVDYVNSILNVNEYDNIRKNIKERLLSKIRKLFGK